MSISRCDRCSRAVDTDADTECYLPLNSRDWECVCESCREGYDSHADDQHNDPRHEPYSNLRR